MIKEGILAAYLLWMAAVDAKTKTVPVWPGIAGILLFSVMRECNVVLGFFLVSSIFLKVCSTWTVYVPIETVNS